VNREFTPARVLRTISHIPQPTTNKHTPTRFGNVIGVVRLEGDTGPSAKTREAARPAGAKHDTPIDDGRIHRQDRKVTFPDERDPTDAGSGEQSPARALIELIHHDLVLFGHPVTSDASSERQYGRLTATQEPGANVPRWRRRAPSNNRGRSSTIHL
jgi:hypothetical protein